MEISRRKVYITGYSVGGALASIFALLYSEIRYADPSVCSILPYLPTGVLPPTAILATYGAPPCGTNRSNFTDTLSVNKKVENYINGGALVFRRYVTQGDPIPRLMSYESGRKVPYTHMGSCCGNTVVRCPGAMNVFDGFFQTLSDGLAGVPITKARQQIQLFSTKKYDVRANSIDPYGCRAWSIDRIDDPSKLRKPEQHADQCGIRFFMPLLSLHVGSLTGDAMGREESRAPHPLARSQADSSVYVPIEGAGLHQVPLYDAGDVRPKGYCEWVQSIRAGRGVSSDSLDKAVNAGYYEVLKNWQDIERDGMDELKDKIVDAVWGGSMGAVQTGYRHESVYGAVLANTSFDRLRGCAKSGAAGEESGAESAEALSMPTDPHPGTPPGTAAGSDVDTAAAADARPQNPPPGSDVDTAAAAAARTRAARTRAARTRKLLQRLRQLQRQQTRKNATTAGPAPAPVSPGRWGKMFADALAKRRGQKGNYR